MRGLALALCLAGAPAVSCERTFILEYDVSYGGWQIELNDVYLDSGGAQFSSGGKPLEGWLLPGENIVAFQHDAEKAEVSLYSLCGDGSGRVDIDAASLTGKGRHEMAFDAADLPPRAFFDADVTGKDDLPALWAAVDALAAAMKARDADAVWALHGALRADHAAQGRPLGALEDRLRKIVAAANPVFADDLRARRMLGGRVWEVHGPDFVAPIRDDAVEVNGGTAPFKTGSFWVRLNGEWSVLAQ